MDHYRRVFGRWPNLLWPRTFNEWINHKKLFDHSPLLTTLADKYEVRRYVHDRVGDEYLAHLYLVASNPAEIDFTALPARFVIKATHGSGWNIIVTDRSAIDQLAAKHQLAQWLARNYYDVGREWCYKNVQPRLLVEEFLGDEAGRLPWDYKFFCFGGHARLIQVDVGRYENHTRNLYDLAWHPLSVRYKHDHADVLVPPPHDLPEMIRVAEALAQGLDFVRVDLYGLAQRICFGEMTHYPENGLGWFDPPGFDALLGSYWPRASLARGRHPKT